MGVGESIKQSLFGNVDTNLLILKIFFVLSIIIAGVICGKLVNFGLKRLFKRIELEKKIKGGILDLFRAILRWSIYVIFLTFGLNQLGTTNLTKAIMSLLIVMPTFVGALIILVIGFGIAHFLRKVLDESGIKNIELLTSTIFYFVVYIAGVYAVKTALVSFGEPFTNYLIMILTAVFGIVGAYFIIKKNQSNSS